MLGGSGFDPSDEGQITSHNTGLNPGYQSGGTSGDSGDKKTTSAIL